MPAGGDGGDDVNVTAEDQSSTPKQPVRGKSTRLPHLPSAPDIPRDYRLVYPCNEICLSAAAAIAAHLPATRH